MPLVRGFAAVALLVTAFSPSGVFASEPVGDVAAGRRLYWEGVGADGEPVKAKTQGDIEISGAQFSCVSCHRPSAYGSSEGGVYVPPIRGEFLFEPSYGDRNRIFKELYQEIQSKEFWAKMRDPRSRPAYSNASLSKAITVGVDPAGRALEATMPRYALNEQDAANVVEFLKSLSAAPDPGVTTSEIHFATILTPGLKEEDVASFRATMDAFFKWKNLHTRGDLSSPGFSPLYRSEFLSTYRAWTLDYWELTGEPETWNDQLQAHYAKRPVFAVIGGLVNGPHAPVADFCDRTGTPCVFPVTELPMTRDVVYRYNLYFSRGRELEAEVMANYVLSSTKSSVPEVRQFYLEDRLGAASAVAFMRYAEPRGARVVSQGFPNGEMLAEAISQCCDSKVDAVIIWPGVAAEEISASLSAKSLKKAAVIGLPSDAIKAAVSADKGVAKKLRFSYPYEKPGAVHPREYDVRAWLSARQVKVTNRLMQFETYFALTMIEHSLQHLLGDFNREYLIELIEHEAEKNLNIGTHPTLALGPGQRFASKGAFIMRLDPESEGGIVPDSDWIIP